MLTLNGYFDDSGTHRGSDSIVVAGFLSDAARWVEFSALWQIALNEFGLDQFHMTDFANQAPPYTIANGWSEQNRKCRLDRLLKIIQGHVSYSVGTVIRRKDFDDAISRRARRICGDAFGLAALVCMIDLVEGFRATTVQYGISYVFETGSKGRAAFDRVCANNMKVQENRERLHLLSWRFEPKKEFLPLQAADILAYELYRESLRLDGNSKHPQRYPLGQLRLVPWRWQRLGSDNLKVMSEVLEARAKYEDLGVLKPL